MKMDPFEAIAWANGWEIAMMGLLVVFLGMCLLAITISQLHRILEFFDKRSKSTWKKTKKSFLAAESQEKPLLSLAGKEGLRDAFEDFALLAEIMPSPISLPAFLEAAAGRGIGRSHAVLADLLKAGVLKADGKGFYLWDQASFDDLMTGVKDRNRA